MTAPRFWYALYWPFGPDCITTCGVARLPSQDERDAFVKREGEWWQPAKRGEAIHYADVSTDTFDSEAHWRRIPKEFGAGPEPYRGHGEMFDHSHAAHLGRFA